MRAPLTFLPSATTFVLAQDIHRVVHIRVGRRRRVLEGARLLRAVAARNFRGRYLDDYVPLFDGCAAMRAIRTMIENLADTDATVLFRGESGTGKDLAARAIHAASTRGDGPFIKVNCGAIPGDLLESELFGHEKGAFAGAYRQKPGQFEYANKGTIYLSEIGDLPLALQGKLLHVLQDLRFSRVGGNVKIDVNVRVLAATNRDLELAMARREFCADLYYRLNAVEIHIPPLRERKTEIPILAERFLAKFNQQYGRSQRLSPETMSALIEHSWGGNVREFENAIRRMVALTDGEQAFMGLMVQGQNVAPNGMPPSAQHGQPGGKSPDARCRRPSGKP